MAIGHVVSVVEALVINQYTVLDATATDSCCRKSRLVLVFDDHTIGCAFGTLCRVSVCDVLYCGETVRLS